MIRSPAAPPLAALVIAAAGLAACSGAGAPGAGAADDASLETATGVVAIVGSDPATTVTVQAREPGGRVTRSTDLTGPVADTLRSMEGLEVEVRGARHGRGLDVRSFRVRALGGLPAADGVLERDGDTAVLRTVDGERVRYAAAPPSLLALEGRRVWIAGKPGGPPQQWGLIAP